MGHVIVKHVASRVFSRQIVGVDVNGPIRIVNRAIRVDVDRAIRIEDRTHADGSRIVPIDEAIPIDEESIPIDHGVCSSTSAIKESSNFVQWLTEWRVCNCPTENVAKRDSSCNRYERMLLHVLGHTLEHSWIALTSSNALTTFWKVSFASRFPHHAFAS